MTPPDYRALYNERVDAANYEHARLGAVWRYADALKSLLVAAGVDVAQLPQPEPDAVKPPWHFRESSAEHDPPEAAAHYRALAAELDDLRRANGEDSPKEDALLDAMDAAWWRMSEDERAAVDCERATIANPGALRSLLSGEAPAVGPLEGE